MNIRRLLGSCLATAALVSGAAAVVASCGGSPSSAGAVVGRPAPAWSGATIDGSHLSSGQERGHWLVLNFFATWCVPCRRETPQLVRFVAHPPDVAGSVHVVGVLYNDSSGAARSFERDHGMTWPIVEDANDDITSAYGVAGLPQSLVIAPDGKLVARLFGGVTVATLDAAVGAS
ncbi:MAG TPA: TlpA disulfide reductase family protein [Acidimicrobiales bacterium]|nr:TlpA disulfide reductase family protein [Acidimicrobiales bacterium]